LGKINHVYFFFGYAGWGGKFHATAKQMIKDNLADKFSGITFGDESFLTLNNQTEIDYKRLDAYEELYPCFKKNNYSEARIDELESNYGGLWKFAYTDRQLITFHHYTKYAEHDLTRDQILNILQGIFDYYEDLIVNDKIDTFITYAVAGVWATVAAAVAKRYGCKYFELVSTRFPDRTALMQGVGQNTFATGITPNEEDKKNAKELLTQFRKIPQQPSYLSIGDVLKSRSEFKLNKVLNLIRPDNNPFDTPQIDVADPGNMTPALLQRIKNWVSFKQNYKAVSNVKCGLFSELPDKTPIAFFPLHVEPEAATMVLAPYYINMLALVENISKSLPANYMLCVKEHPNMLGMRPISYYQALSKIPNLILLPPKLNSISVIIKSKLVITINSTAGLEAALLQKPVITFGSCHYNNMSVVNHFNQHINNLEEYISNTISEFKPDDNGIVEFLAFCLANSVDINTESSWAEQGEEVNSYIAEKFCKLIMMGQEY
jgi:hypothetical protein